MINTKNNSILSKQSYNILDYGARICDSLQTPCIQKAIDDCFLNGGGQVIIPSGIFRSGSLRLRSGVTLYLQCGAILMASTNPEDYCDYIDDCLEPPYIPDGYDLNAGEPGYEYPFTKWHRGFIRAINAQNIAIIGEKGSYIDGLNCYDPEGEERYRGPHAISIQYCENVLLEGYTVINSANWAHAIFSTKEITARHLTVYGGHDGFDIRTCDNVLIEECNFHTGDDSIAGFDNCNVIIKKCILDSACSALRFGGNNILVDSCRSISPASFAFRGSMPYERKVLSALTNVRDHHDMLTFFLYYCDYRAKIRKTPGDILIRNCEIENPDGLFELSFDGKHRWCTNRSLSSIRFENCRVTGVKKPIHIHGDADEPLNFELNNVQISARKGFNDKPVINAVNYSQITLNNVTLSSYEAPAIHTKTDGPIYSEASSLFEIIKDIQ